MKRLAKSFELRAARLWSGRRSSGRGAEDVDHAGGERRFRPTTVRWIFSFGEVGECLTGSVMLTLVQFVLGAPCRRCPGDVDFLHAGRLGQIARPARVRVRRNR